FRSDRYEPSYVQVRVNNIGYGNFLLNDAPITHDVTIEDIEGGVRTTWKTHGGYNDSITNINPQQSDLYNKLKNADTDEMRDSIQNAILAIYVDRIKKNADNILGYRLFLASESKLSLDSVENLLEQYPALKKYNKVNDAIDRKRILKDTQPGNKFRDFSVTYDGVTHKLSDIVGKGDYVLMDFWAFWCRPCRAEMPYIKDVYNRFKDKNFKVIGIAISDNPEKDMKTASDLELPWEIWVNGYNATKEYNISSIPHLILFGPDGTILERGFRKDDILPTVGKYFD
ncbi:MAG: TlpA family protein disulfide reductase, partial [Muribaculaceae bacterium]|nr:TlpA family protein disulfide reductase [Muribaculaceae bacterium]